MKSSILIIGMIALQVVVFSQCKSKKQTTEATASKNAIPEVIVHDSYSYPKDTPAFEITSAEIKGDILTLVVSYSGGCKDHSFSMHCTKMYMKCMPPKLGIFLEHNANGDTCREVKTETLQFNLKTVRYPGTEKDYTVIIGINNFKDDLTYNY